MFKYKPDKLKNQEKISTLDATHRDYMKSFEKSRNSLNVKKDKLVRLTKKLNSLNSENHSKLSDNDIKQKITIKEEIQLLQQEINDVSNYETEMDYYSKIDNILVKYYDIIDNADKDNTSNSPEQTVSLSDQILVTQKKQNRKRSRVQQPQSNILGFFDKTPEIPADDVTEFQSETSDIVSESIPDKTQMITSDNIRTIRSNLPKNRAYLYEQYMKSINNYTNQRNVKRQYNSVKICEKCNVERILSQTEGMYICNVCGNAENAIIESDIPNYKESDGSKPLYPYKRLNHLVELIGKLCL